MPDPAPRPPPWRRVDRLLPAVRRAFLIGVPFAFVMICGFIAVPNYVDFRGRSKSSEAKRHLRALAATEPAPECTTEWTGTPPGVPQGSRLRYAYHCDPASEMPTVFVARGTAREFIENDIWAVAVKGQPENCFDGIGTLTARKNLGSSAVCRRAFQILGVDPRTLHHRDGTTDDVP